MARTDWALALLLAGLTLATRIPFRARLLPTWDAVQFALALTEYDVVRHQPHPPGYILYIAAARACAALLGDATLSLTWLAIGASAVAVLLVYRLARILYGRATALAAAIAFAASPLFWFYGVVGLSYAVEAALATLVAGLAWSMRRGQPRSLICSGLALGLAGGVRQSILVVLLPLWLGMAWAGFRRWRPVLGGLVLIALTSAAWLVPMVVLTGGVRPYIEAALELFDSTVRATTILGLPGEWSANLRGLMGAIALGMGVLLLAFAGLIVWGVRRTPRWGAREGFLVAWIVPPLAVYGGVHFGQPGYLLTVLPALYILAARWLVATLEALAAARRWAVPRGALAAAVVAGSVLAHTAFFVSAGPVDAPEPPAGASAVERSVTAARAFYRFRLWAFTAGGLHEQEGVIRAYVEAVRLGFDPADTALVTELGNPRSYPWLRHVTYYLPEFTVYQLRLGRFAPGFRSSPRDGTAVGSPDVVLPASVRRLVWMVDYWNPTVPRPLGLEERALAHGRWLYVLDLDHGLVVHAGYRLMPVAAMARLR